jgi:hypothetical protein
VCGEVSGGGIEQEVVIVVIDIGAGGHIGGLLVGHKVVAAAGVEEVKLGGVLGHFVLMVMKVVIVDQCRVVGGGAGLGEDQALLDGVGDHVGQLHCVLGGEGCCVVLESHYLASFMSHNVCLR